MRNKKIIKQNKKAEMTSEQIIGIVLLIVGFIIVLLLYFGIDWTGQTDQEVCHLSVVARGSLPDTLELKELPPLKCKTKKVCVTDKTFGKGTCETFGKEYDSVKVSDEQLKQEGEIKKVFADELVDCWNMMGEGKIQLFKQFILEKRSACVICSRIAFDADVETKKVDNFAMYLNNKIPNKNISYWKFLTANKAQDYSLASDAIGSFDTKEKAIIFTEVDGKGLTNMMAKAPGMAVGFVTGNVGAGILSIGVGVEINDWIKTLSWFNVVDYYSSIYVVDYNAKDISELQCDSIESLG